MSLNILQNIFVGKLVNSAQGPIVSSQIYDDRTLTYLDVYEWEVYNGAKFTSPPTFGMFASIMPMNMTKSKMRVMLAPGYPDAPVFDEVSGEAKNYSKYLSDATIIRKVVPHDFDVATVEIADFWDIRLEPIDAAHSMLVKIYADSPVVQGYVVDRDTFATRGFTEEIIPALGVTAPTGGMTEITPVDVFHSLRRIETIPTAALTAYALVFPIRINLDLPRVLKAIAVTWNEQYSIGTQESYGYEFSSGNAGSVSFNVPDSASSSASITAELQVTFEDFATNNLFADNRVFFMEGPVTQATVLARLTTIYGVGVTMWPVFKPQSHSIIVTGQSIAIRANCAVSLKAAWSPTSYSHGASSTVSDDFSVGMSNNSVQLPPCIHGNIALTGGTSKSQAVSATATMNISLTTGASISATKTKTGTAYGEVRPTVVPATSGQNSIPITGRFLMDMDVAPTEYPNWFKVRAEIFNAANLA